jgi:3-isopropylmalate dehydrogenase
MKQTLETRTILLLPGDGIGPEIMREAEKIIAWLNERHKGDAPRFRVHTKHVGGAAYEAEGHPLPAATLQAAREADAVLLAAVGGPQWENIDFALRPERGLLGLRKGLELFANLRPALCFDELVEASSLKPEIVTGLDLLIVRELTGDVYFGEPRGVETLADGTRRGVNTMVYTTSEITRIARVALDLAGRRGGKLCSVDKANVLEVTGLWREEVQKLRDAEYPDIALSHLYVDNAAMQLVRNPRQFDVIVTGNLFGDILSDCAAMLTGSLGMLPSASLGARLPDGRIPALYEPVHGSAPDIAGRNVANPLAMILSLAMMLRYSFDDRENADLIERAVRHALSSGYRTNDILQPGTKRVTTSEMGDAVLAAMTQIMHTV